MFESCRARQNPNSLKPDIHLLLSELNGFFGNEKI